MSSQTRIFDNFYFVSKSLRSLPWSFALLALCSQPKAIANPDNGLTKLFKDCDIPKGEGVEVFGDEVGFHLGPDSTEILQKTIETETANIKQFWEGSLKNRDEAHPMLISFQRLEEHTNFSEEKGKGFNPNLYKLRPRSGNGLDILTEHSRLKILSSPIKKLRDWKGVIQRKDPRLADTMEAADRLSQLILSHNSVNVNIRNSLDSDVKYKTVNEWNGISLSNPTVVATFKGIYPDGEAKYIFEIPLFNSQGTQDPKNPEILLRKWKQYMAEVKKIETRLEELLDLPPRTAFGSLPKKL